MRPGVFAGLASLARLSQAAVTSQPYIWNNVHIGGGGGFVPSVIFNPSSQGLAYIRYIYILTLFCQTVQLTFSAEQTSVAYIV